MPAVGSAAVTPPEFRNDIPCRGLTFGTRSGRMFGFQPPTSPPRGIKIVKAQGFAPPDEAARCRWAQRPPPGASPQRPGAFGSPQCSLRNTCPLLCGSPECRRTEKKATDSGGCVPVRTLLQKESPQAFAQIRAHSQQFLRCVSQAMHSMLQSSSGSPITEWAASSLLPIRRAAWARPRLPSI